MDKKNLKNLTLSEIFTSSLYLERLFQALSSLEDLNSTVGPKQLAGDLVFDIKVVLQQKVLRAELHTNKKTALKLSAALLEVKKCTSLIESVIKLDFNLENSIEAAQNLINLFYHYAFKLHQILDENTDLEIQLPRTALSFEKKKSGNIPLYELSLKHLFETASETSGSVSSLSLAREKKYKELLKKGHQFIFNKNYEEALKSFKRALNYNETAEAYTLLGWAYGLQEKIEKAKSYCLMAIKRDPDYGPPYNDLGNYLLKEGQVEESIKWFHLAKKSVNYQNREYPYINSGRAYIIKKDFKNALEEFSKALALAPYHDELHETISKLKKTLLKKEGLEKKRSPVTT